MPDDRGALRVCPVTPERWDDLEALFRSAATTHECWCMWPRCAPRSFQPGEQHRAEMRALVLAGRVPGLIALERERPVGWCALGRRRDYAQYESADRDAADVWAIPCLYVAADRRGTGVGRALLEAAIARAAEAGAAILHGPPPWWRPEAGTNAAGPAEAFAAAGFRRAGSGARMAKFELHLRSADTPY